MIILVNSSCSLYRQSWSEEIFCRSLCLMVVTWFICRWIVPKKNNRFFITKYLVTLCTNSEVSNNHTLSVYLFPRKILPFVFISPLLNSTMAALCIYLFLENSLWAIHKPRLLKEGGVKNVRIYLLKRRQFLRGHKIAKMFNVAKIMLPKLISK